MKGIKEGLDTNADLMFEVGGLIRRQQENRMERNAAEHRVDSITAEMDKLDIEIEEETGTLDVLREKSRQTRALFEFQRRRTTNAAFYTGTSVESARCIARRSTSRLSSAAWRSV